MNLIQYTKCPTKYRKFIQKKYKNYYLWPAEETNWSGSTLFAIKYVTLYQQSGSNNLIGWQLEVGVAA